MKKKFFFAAALAVIVSGGAMLKANASANETEGLSDLQKANIEALSSDPPAEYYDVKCYSELYADKDKAVVECASCSMMTGWASAQPSSICRKKAN